MIKRGIICKLPSDPAAVEPLCLDLAQLLQQHELTQHLFGIELVARELLNNAIFHGNRQSPDKQVDFSLRIGSRWICMAIGDQGAGYNWRQLRRTLADTGATSGRGIAIARLYGQKVRFGDSGRRVEVWFEKCGQGEGEIP